MLRLQHRLQVFRGSTRITLASEGLATTHRPTERLFPAFLGCQALRRREAPFLIATRCGILTNMRELHYPSDPPIGEKEPVTDRKESSVPAADYFSFIRERMK